MATIFGAHRQVLNRRKHNAKLGLHACCWAVQIVSRCCGKTSQHLLCYLDWLLVSLFGERSLACERNEKLHRFWILERIHAHCLLDRHAHE